MGPRNGAHYCALVLAVSATLLSACGGSSGDAHGSSTASTAVGTTKARRDVVKDSAAVQRPLRDTGGSEVNDDNPGSADSGDDDASTADTNPCRLVTRAQAQAILGTPVAAPQEAPLGPTCIYQPTGGGAQVTLAVQAISLARLKPRIRHRRKIVVSGRTGYCGTYGQPTTFVALADGSVLSVTASCQVGRVFAAAALTRLGK